MFFTQDNIDKDLMPLFATFLDRKGIHEMIKICSDIIKNPVILVDSAFQLITASQIDNINESSWVDLVQNGFSSNDHVRSYRKNHIYQQILKSTQPLIISAPSNNEINILICKISIKGKIIGILGVLGCNTCFHSINLHQIEKISQIISHELERGKHLNNIHNGINKHILLDLLQGKPNQSGRITDRVELLNLNKSKHFSVVVLKSQDNSEFLNTSYIKIQIKHLMPNSIYLDYNNDIILLLLHPLNNPNEDENTHLRRLIQENNFVAGISEVFQDILQLKSYYNLAKKSLELGIMLNKKERLYKSSDYYLHLLLSTISDQTELMNYYSSELNLIKNYDKLHNTEYTLTLHEYLSSGKNIISMSNNLHAHRNTISHRLKRISEIGRLDLSNVLTCHKLYISFIIDQLTFKKT